MEPLQILPSFGLHQARQPGAQPGKDDEYGQCKKDHQYKGKRSDKNLLKAGLIHECCLHRVYHHTKGGGDKTHLQGNDRNNSEPGKAVVERLNHGEHEGNTNEQYRYGIQERAKNYKKNQE